MEFSHKPVMLDEVLGFVPIYAKVALDLTVGGGNHAHGILKTYPDLFLYGIDRDAEAVASAAQKLAAFSHRIEIIHGPYSQAIQHFLDLNIKADFILVDLGVSSKQLDDHSRGFSFRSDGPLDMRMNREDTRTAADLINLISEKDLMILIRKYGEEIHARRIARNIVSFRDKHKFTSTRQLADCIEQAVPVKYRYKRIHPATKTFQALRIEVNHEIDELNTLLGHLLQLLNPGGRVAIITFHSLEDRPVKHTFRHWANPCQCPTDLPICICGLKPVAQLLNKKIITATKEEREINPRSRSAKLRVAEKL